MDAATEIKNRIDNTPHLQEASVEDVKEALDKEAEATQKSEVPEDNPRDKEEFLRIQIVFLSFQFCSLLYNDCCYDEH